MLSDLLIDYSSDIFIMRVYRGNEEVLDFASHFL